MPLQPIFKTRTFASIVQPPYTFQVVSCTYSDQGGPRTARLVARCTNNPSLPQLMTLLRCPVELHGSAGRAAWWGLVWSVSIQDGALSATVTLDDIANRVQVAYSDMNPMSSGAGTRQTSAWLDDLASQAVYGIKETQLSLTSANQAQAEAYRAVHLAASSQPTLRAGGCSGGVGADGVRPNVGPYGRLIVLECRGWWDTLDWRYYAAPALSITNSNVGPSTVCNFGWAGVSEKLAQSITIPQSGWFACTVMVALYRLVDLATNVVVELCADAAGQPGTVLASATYPGATLPLKGYVWARFALSAAAGLPAGNYWIVLSDSALAGSAQYRAYVDLGLHYPGGGYLFYNGAAWIPSVPDIDLQFSIGFTLETTEQIRAMVTSAGQFFTGLRLETPSGLYTNPFRSGDTTALAEITRHLAAGTLAGQRLTADVTPDRCLVIKAKADPSAGSALKVGRDGILRQPGGAPVQPGPGLAGTWAALDAPWSTITPLWGRVPGLVYLNAVEWRADPGWVSPVPAIS